MKHSEVKRQQMELLTAVLGCITLLLFGGILGNNGMAYLGIAYISISVVQTFVCGGVQEGLSKILRVRMEKEQYRNVEVTQKRIQLFQGIIGFLVSVIFAMGAGFLAETVFQIHYSTVIIRFLAASLFFRGLSSVLSGCLMGRGNEGLAFFVSPLRKILILLLGLIFANKLGNYGIKVSDLLGNEAYTAMYAGVGVALAVSLTEVILFLYVCFVFLSKRRLHKAETGEGMKQVDSLPGTFRSFYGVVFMPMLLRLFPILTLWLGMLFYRKNTVDERLFAENFGMFCGRFLALCGIPVLMICIVLLIRYLRKIRHAKNSYQNGLRAAVFSALFFTMYYAVMSGPLANMLEQTGNKVLGEMLAYGSSLIFFTVLVFYFSQLLSGFGKTLFLPIVYGLMTVGFAVISSLLLSVGKIGVMAFIYAGIAMLAMGCILLGVLCCKLLHIKIDWLRMFAIPIGIVAAIGLLCMLLGKLFTPHLGNFVTALVTLLLGGILYWILYKRTSFY